jgi:shikimate dehydrogenase
MTPLEDVNMINTDSVIDIVYNPEETVLMKKYKERNVKTVNGLTMLIFQAIKSEEIWNDEKYDDEILQKIHEELSEKLYK